MGNDAVLHVGIGLRKRFGGGCGVGQKQQHIGAIGRIGQRPAQQQLAAIHRGEHVRPMSGLMRRFRRVQSGVFS